MQETPATPTSIAIDLSPPRKNIAASSGTQEGSKETFTPTKILNQISPIPNLPEKRRQRAKQSASHITAKDYISSKMEKLEKNLLRQIENKRKHQEKIKKKSKIARRTIRYETSESEEDEDEDSVCLVCLSPE